MIWRSTTTKAQTQIRFNQSRQGNVIKLRKKEET